MKKLHIEFDFNYDEKNVPLKKIAIKEALKRYFVGEAIQLSNAWPREEEVYPVITNIKITEQR